MEEIKNLNLNESIIKIRVELQNSKLKKSGKNKFAGFNYFELSDFLPRLNELMSEYGVNDIFTIEDSSACLKLIKGSEKQEYKIPFKEYETPINQKINDKTGEVKLVKSMQDIQYLGALNTYYKRYLYLNAFGITDGDIIDSIDNTDVEEITPEFAKNYVIRFGKNKGRKLADLDDGYIDWLLNNTEDQTIIKCIELLFGKTKLSDEEQDNRMWLLAQINDLVIKENINREDLYKYYKVKSDSEMTEEQLKDCLNRLEGHQE